MTEHPHPTPDPRYDDRPDAASPFVSAAGHPRRRTVLKAAGLLTLAGGGTAVLAACSSGETTSPSPSTAASSTAASSPSAARSSSEPSKAPSSATKKTPSGPSVSESSVPAGSGVIMEDADFVVTQPSTGEFKAFSKICTHQNCAVAEVTDTIDCKCHGSKFSITDGSVVNGPASQPLAESTTTVTGGKVYVGA